jgi:hypothetical protein
MLTTVTLTQCHEKGAKEGEEVLLADESTAGEESRNAAGGAEEGPTASVLRGIRGLRGD